MEGKMRNLAIIGVIFCLALGGGVAGVVVANQPENVAAAAITGIVDDFLARDEIKPIKNTLTGGSVDLSFEGAKDEDGEDLFNGSVSGKLYFDKDAYMLSDLNVSIEDAKIEGDLYVSKDLIYVSEDKILEGTYGVKLSTIAEDLSNSIFAADSDSEYAMDEETYDILISALETLEDTKAIERDATKLAKTLVKDIWKIVVENAEIESESKSVKLNGSKEEVRLISIKVDDEAKANIVQGIYDYLCESDDINKFLEKHGDTFVPLLAETGYNEEEDGTLVEAYEEFLDEYEDDIEKICENMEGTETITVNVATPKLTSTLLKLEVKVGKETMFTLDCGKDGLKKTDTVTLEVDGLTVTYKVAENDKDAFKATLEVADTYGEDDEVQAVIGININKEKGSYSAYVETYDYYSYNYEDGMTVYRYEVKGDYAKKGDTTTMTVEKLVNTTTRTVNGSEESKQQSTSTVEAQLIFDTNDKMPKPVKDYETIADIKEEDIERWIENAEDLDL